MSTHSIHTTPQPNDLVTTRVARRAAAHLRALPERIPAATEIVASPAPDAQASSTSAGARILRRWSVAELIARATAAPPAVA